MIMFPDQNAGNNHNMYRDRQQILWKVGRVQVFGNKSKDQNSVQEEVKIRLKSGNACYHSVQNIFFSSLLSKSIKIKVYRTMILATTKLAH